MTQMTRKCLGGKWSFGKQEIQWELFTAKVNGAYNYKCNPLRDQSESGIGIWHAKKWDRMFFSLRIMLINWWECNQELAVKSENVPTGNTV